MRRLLCFPLWSWCARHQKHKGVVNTVCIYWAHATELKPLVIRWDFSVSISRRGARPQHYHPVLTHLFLISNTTSNFHNHCLLYGTCAFSPWSSSGGISPQHPDFKVCWHQVFFDNVEMPTGSHYLGSLHMEGKEATTFGWLTSLSKLS